MVRKVKGPVRLYPVKEKSFGKALLPRLDMRRKRAPHPEKDQEDHQLQMYPSLKQEEAQTIYIAGKKKLNGDGSEIKGERLRGGSREKQNGDPFYPQGNRRFHGRRIFGVDSGKRGQPSPILEAEEN